MYGHGMTAREGEIMDRAEAGVSTKDIAAELGVGAAYVAQVKLRCNGSWADNIAFEAMVVRGTIALAAAAARVGRFT